MFSSLKLRILLGIYVLILISIPVGAYLATQQTAFKSKASETTTKKVAPSPKPSIKPAAKELLESSLPASKPSPSPTQESTAATSYGPTLSLKVIFEGSPKDDMSGRLFVGIVEGKITLNPKFLLSFTFDVPKGGEYTNISLAGLNPGSSYSALLKGRAQIASASAFVMSPTVTNLNNGGAILLLSGDLNEDNTINTQDYSIAQKAMGSSPKSSNWNENADFNKDKIINILDLAILNKNFGKIGDSGAWTSPLPQATPSASVKTPSAGGYWLWVPN